MKKSLFAVVLALFAGVTLFVPQTPAQVPDPVALLASAKNVVTSDLEAALARREAAVRAAAEAARIKAKAEAEFADLEAVMKNVTECHKALKKAIDERLTTEVGKLRSATETWTAARADFSAATPATGASPAVVVTAKKKFDESVAQLAEATDAFAAFVDEVNAAAGTAIPEVLDPLVAADAFAAAKKKLDEEVASLAGQVATANAEAAKTATTSAGAEAELRAAQKAVQEAATALAQQAIAARLERPLTIELPADVNAAIAALVKNAGDQVTAIRELKDELAKTTATVGQVKTAVEGVGTNVSTLDTTVKTGFAELSKILGSGNSEIAKISAEIASSRLSQEAKAAELAGILNRMEARLGKSRTDATLQEILGLLRTLEEKIKKKEQEATQVAPCYGVEYNQNCGRWFCRRRF